jgi:hypothetical protein
MKCRRVRNVITVLVAVSCVSASAHAADVGRVINLAGKQRMLTQKMSKEAFLVAKGIDVSGNTENLKQTSALFDRTLHGLMDGDVDLGLDRTEDVAILEQLNKVATMWITFNESIQEIVAGDTDEATLLTIADQNVPLLKEMNVAVQMYASASGSMLDKGLATTINLAGKQRMLTQKMTKELLLIACGIDADANRIALGKTVAVFDKTLTGLINGESELGLPATSDKAIVAQLEKVRALWREYRPVVESADTSNAALLSAANMNMPLLKEMNTAVKMFENVANK